MALASWQLFDVSRAHPDYPAYFWQPARDTPYRWLNDSDLDWGQDLDRLATALERRGINDFYLSYFGTADPDHHGLPSWRPLPDDRQVDGCIAISLFHLREMFLTEGPSGPFAWLADHEPVEQVGSSIWIYYIDSSPGKGHRAASDEMPGT